jgi:integrase
MAERGGWHSFEPDHVFNSHTINGEISVLRQVLKRAKLWYRFADEYRALRNRKPPVGQALTAEEQERLFAIAQTKPAWLYAYVASTLAFYCGLRACEAKALRWQDVDWSGPLLHVRRSKTPAGWRSPTLNATCLTVLRRLHDQASLLGFVQPDHFVFPWQGRNKRIDPTKPLTSWRSAWRSIRKAAGLTSVRFHDGRHTAITTLAEKGLPDWVIQAQVGHVAPEMMKTYSHIRREALNQAAAALEPTALAPPAPPEKPTAVLRHGVTKKELRHSPRHNSRIVADDCSNFRGKMARHLGRFSQLLAHGCVILHVFAALSSPDHWLRDGARYERVRPQDRLFVAATAQTGPPFWTVFGTFDRRALTVVAHLILKLIDGPRLATTQPWNRSDLWDPAALQSGQCTDTSGL